MGHGQSAVCVVLDEKDAFGRLPRKIRERNAYGSCSLYLNVGTIVGGGREEVWRPVNVSRQTALSVGTFRILVFPVGTTGITGKILFL